MTTSLRRADADSEKILAVADWYHRQWPAMDLTITALEKWYSHFLAMADKRNKKKSEARGCLECGIGGGLHLADCPNG